MNENLFGVKSVKEQEMEKEQIENEPLFNTTEREILSENMIEEAKVEEITPVQTPVIEEAKPVEITPIQAPVIEEAKPVEITPVQAPVIEEAKPVEITPVQAPVIEEAKPVEITPVQAPVIEKTKSVEPSINVINNQTVSNNYNEIKKDIAFSSDEEATLVISPTNVSNVNMGKSNYELAESMKPKTKTFRKRSNNGILRTDIGIKSGGFTRFASLGAIVAVGALIIMYFAFRF